MDDSAPQVSNLASPVSPSWTSMELLYSSNILFDCLYGLYRSPHFAQWQCAKLWQHLSTTRKRIFVMCTQCILSACSKSCTCAKKVPVCPKDVVSPHTGSSYVTGGWTAHSSLHLPQPHLRPSPLSFQQRMPRQQLLADENLLHQTRLPYIWLRVKQPMLKPAG